MVNPHTSWEQLFLETMKLLLAKFGKYGPPGGGWVWRRGLIRWIDKDLIFSWAFPMCQAHCIHGLILFLLTSL